MSWQKELTANLHQLKQLEPYFPDLVKDRITSEELLSRYPMSIPTYYFSLIDRDNPDDPIRKMCVPSFEEMDVSGDFDTSGESDNTVITGMQHKYRQTALILSTNRCAMYCRHCFRKRMVGLSDQEVAKHFDEIMEYIRVHEEITNVLVSGGDAFLNSNQVLGKYLERLSAIEHLDLIRFGTRLPVVFPQRISEDEELLDLLRTYGAKKQIYVVTQFNHPNEITPESVKAIQKMQEAGVVVKNQTVLLKGVNNDSDVLGLLLRKLTRVGVVPYYIFQCRPVASVKNHFQVPLLEGYDIVEKAKQQQNGQGKCLKYILSNQDGKIEIVGKVGSATMLFKYHQAKLPENQSKLFSMELSPADCWVEAGVRK
ncbi:MAG: KamA family radical SAM protein [Clostridiales bacterium]|jgi:lysine 2,3-aminomutase|nr:KamA family radical SAM protein [Clostridiales bacterium]